MKSRVGFRDLVARGAERSAGEVVAELPFTVAVDMTVNLAQQDTTA